MRLCLVICCVVGALFAAQAQLANPASYSADSGYRPVEDSDAELDSILSLSEVSVSAIKQPHRLSTQPISSTVVSGEVAERHNIVTMKQMSEVAPNLYIPNYGSRMTSSIYMRGIGARIDQPAVGLNVDNVPFLNKDNYDFDLVDIDRIEVLRGPQSVLYGRNTMGGLINIYTLSPFKYQGVRVMGGYGSGNSGKAALSVYQLLDENVAMSLSAYYIRTGGFYTNEYNGEKADWERQGNLRWKMAWRPTDRLNVQNTAALSISRQGGYPYEFIETGKISYNDTCFYKRTGITDGLTIKWDGDSVSLSSITSFQYINDNMTLDQDFQPVEYFTLTQRRHEWALTQDFVASGKVGDYKWTGGLFGFYKRTSMSAPVDFGEVGIEQLVTGNYNKNNPSYPIEWNQDNFLLNSDFIAPTWGLAAYHQSSYQCKRWTATLGMRLDYERAQLNYRSHTSASYTIYDATVSPSVVYSQVPVNIDETGDLNSDYLQLLPKISLSYQWGVSASDNIYVSIAKGYKAGGYNTQMFSDVLQQKVMEQLGIAMNYKVSEIVRYKPEKSWNYEIGGHFSLLNRRLTGSLAMFYIDCQDQQLTVFPPGMVTGRIMTNAGRTRSYGVEVSANYKPTERWALSLSYGWNDVRFSEYDNGKQDFEGCRVPYAPQHTLFASATYVQPISQSWLDNIAFTCSARGVGDIYWNEANTIKQPFYALLGASVKFSWRDYSLDVWGENLSDTAYDMFYFISMGNSFLQRGLPCRWGATLRLNFNI